MSTMKPPSDPSVEPREKLPEEIQFDQRVYGGISYAAQALTGIVLTRWLKYGSAKPHFEKAAQWLGQKIYRNRSAEEAAKEISSPLLVTTMVMVGNMFLLPVKYFENRKASYVRAMHEKTLERMEEAGTPCQPEELERREKALQALEKEPSQSWASLLGGRFFGLVPVFALAYGLGKKGNIAEEFAAKTISKGLELAGAKQLAKSKTLESYVHVGFLDIFYSMVSAGGLYVYSHFVNPPKHPRDEGLIPDIIIGPTPGTPAFTALETGQKYEDYIDLDKQTNSKQFAANITRQTMAPKLKSEPIESFQKKIADEQKQSSLSPALTGA